MAKAPSPPTRRQNISWKLMLLAIIIMLCIINSLYFVFYLSTVPDVTWQRGDLVYDRIFLARTNRPAGIGIESQRVIQNISDDKVCVGASITYFMWKQNRETKGQNALYSQVYRQTTPNNWQPTGKPCN